MSYLGAKEYNIVPTKSYEIVHNCSGCGSKSVFVNTNCFRVNANGNCLDVWLIYQCNKCRHTYNLTIYERVKSKSIKQEEYERFLANESDLAFRYGTDKQLMKRNKAEINWSEAEYRIIGEKLDKEENIEAIIIHNPANLKIRTEKVLSEIMEMPRQEIGRMVQNRNILYENKTLGDVTKIYFDKRKAD